MHSFKYRLALVVEGECILRGMTMKQEKGIIVICLGPKPLTNSIRLTS